MTATLVQATVLLGLDALRISVYQVSTALCGVCLAAGVQGVLPAVCECSYHRCAPEQQHEPLPGKG